jgi:hypothetical protein
VQYIRLDSAQFKQERENEMPKKNIEARELKFFKVVYKNGTFEIKASTCALKLIQDNELYTKEHISTHIFELSGEQEAIARDNYYN